MGTAPMRAKGDYGREGTDRGVGISSCTNATRRYYRPRPLTVRAIESLFRPGARSR